MECSLFFQMILHFFLLFFSASYLIVITRSKVNEIDRELICIILSFNFTFVPMPSSFINYKPLESFLLPTKLLQIDSVHL